jgi:hypothetical protein
MSLWSRVFARHPQSPEPAALLAHLNQLTPVAGHFVGDDQGWFRAELSCGTGAPLHLERYLSSEEGIRAELNNWAAFLETCDYSPAYLGLMERVIQTTQLFTVRRPVDHSDDVLVDRVSDALCRYLAGAMDGVIQVDGVGFFAADGAQLLQEY